jgi:hypothetical protein
MFATLRSFQELSGAETQTLYGPDAAKLYDQVCPVAPRLSLSVLCFHSKLSGVQRSGLAGQREGEGQLYGCNGHILQGQPAGGLR